MIILNEDHAVSPRSSQEGSGSRHAASSRFVPAKIAVAIAIPVLLSGCVSSASRLCSGFDHPAAELWTGGDAQGDQRTYVDGTGGTLTYVLREIRLSEPREQESNDASDDQVSCIEGADYLYVADAADTAFNVGFRQNEAFLEEPVEEQLIELDLDVENPVGNRVTLGPEFGFDLLNPETSNDGEGSLSTGRFLATATVGETDYVNLLERTLVDPGTRYPIDVAEPARWVRILFAQGAGLVQYELLDGTVYTLVP